MKLFILGAGAMGCLFAARLAGTQEVALVDPNDGKRALLQSRGLEVREPDGTVLRAHPRVLSPEEASRETADLLLVLVKASREREALEAVKGAVGAHTLVMTLQNGLGHEAAMGRVAPAENLILGATQHNASLLAPGVVRHGGGGWTQLGAVTGEGARFAFVAEAFSRAGFEAAVSPNVRAVIWRKLFLNASASALTGVFRCPLGDVAEKPHLWAIAEKLINEAVAVAGAEGLPFDGEEIRSEVRAHVLRAKDAITSVYADLAAGRKTEVDAITGAVAALGREKGIAVPVSETVAAILHGMEEMNDGKQL